MDDTRIAVYAISLNEARHVPRFVAACAEADLVLIADTGSRDDTVAVARAAGAVVHEIAVSPWRFDDARNAALSLVPRSIDVCVALDLDEIPAPGWAAALRRAWQPDTTRGEFLHVWTHLPDGSPGVQYMSDRAHLRHGHRWRHACHEAVYGDRIKQKWIRIEDMRVDHWPDRGKSRKQYLDLLEATRDEDPGCARNSYHLGREYLYYERAADAEQELRRFLALPYATWKTQRANAMRHIATCRAKLGDPAGEIDWLRRAVAEAPDKRDAWVGLARALWQRGDWEGCEGAVTAALRQHWTPRSAVSEDGVAGPHPYDLAAMAAWKLGRRREALGHAERALELAPADPRLARNVEVMRRKLQAREVDA